MSRVFGLDVPGLTEPDRRLLDPEAVKRGAQEFIDLVCPLLRELVNFSSHARGWVEAGMKTLPKDVAWAPARLHYQVIEMVDGVEVLLREACGYPAMGPLRSAFEANLYLAAIHSYPDFDRASLTWLVGQVKRRINDLRKMSPDHGISRTTVVVCAPEDQRLYRELRTSIEGLQKALDAPHLRSIAKEATNPWYRTLFNAGNLRELSINMDKGVRERGGMPEEERLRERTYTFLYGRYANTLHGSDFDRMFGPKKSDRPYIASLRNPAAIAEVARMAASAILEATRLQVRRFRPDKEAELVEWYINKVRDRYVRLSEMEVKVEWVALD